MLCRHSMRLRAVRIRHPRLAGLQQPSSGAKLLRCAPQRHYAGTGPCGPAERQQLSAEALGQRYCELQGVALSDEMRDRLLLTVAAATSEHSAASYLAWLETLDDESQAVIQQLVESHKAGDMLKAPERTRGWRVRQTLATGASLAAKLKEQAQQELARKAMQRGWRPKEERERAAGFPNDGASSTDGKDMEPENQLVHQNSKPRTSFEELLPDDWREAGRKEDSQSSSGSVSAVVEHTWHAEEVGDLALTEGEMIEVLSDTEPGSGWWTGRRCGGDGPSEEGIFPANYVSIVLDTDAIDASAAGDESGLARSSHSHEGPRSMSDAVEMPIAAHKMMRRASTSLSQLRAELDRRVIGQPHVKEGIVLALMTREHIYIEGPPGVAKTFTAEITAQVTALSAYM